MEKEREIHIVRERDTCSDRENKIVLVSLSEGTMGGGRGKKMLENEKY
jgi:hypothetical protein